MAGTRVSRGNASAECPGSACGGDADGEAGGVVKGEGGSAGLGRSEEECEVCRGDQARCAWIARIGGVLLRLQQIWLGEVSILSLVEFHQLLRT